MTCVYCGKATEALLCEEHRTAAVLDELMTLMRRYNPEECGNPHVRAFVESFDPWTAAYNDGFAQILELVPADEAAYERCCYLGEKRRPGFEEEALAYLDENDWEDRRTQDVMFLLLGIYNRRDFLKPAPYVDFICGTEGLANELYVSAIGYLGMTGDYDGAAELAEFAKEQVAASGYSRWGRNEEEQLAAIAEAVAQNEKWRAKRYWPRDPEAQEQLTRILEGRGLEAGRPHYGGGGGRKKAFPDKVSKDDFAPVQYVRTLPADFCALWLRDVPGRVKSACEIVAAKVEDNDRAGDFRSLMRPLKPHKEDKALAANCLGISVEGLGKAPHPHEALTGLFAFAEGLTLAVLDGAQVELLVRSARYAGLKALPCAVFVTVDNPSLGGPAKELLDSISDTQTSESAPAFKGMRELTVPTFTSFVAFDTETTGLGNGDRLTEIGAVRVEDGRIVDRFQMLTDPGRHIPEDVAKLTGISDDMVAGQPDNKTVAAAFKEFAGDAVLVGHNIGFDLRMLASAAVPAGITFTNDYFDTNRLAQALKQTQGWEKTKLGYLTEKLGVELTHAHRALADAEATVGVYLKLRELAR